MRTVLCSQSSTGSIAGLGDFAAALWRAFALCGRICGSDGNASVKCTVEAVVMTGIDSTGILTIRQILSSSKEVIDLVGDDIGIRKILVLVGKAGSVGHVISIASALR